MEQSLPVPVQPLAVPTAGAHFWRRVGVQLIAVCEGLHGATLGKLVLGVHVLQEGGKPVSMVGAFVRSLGWLIAIAVLVKFR